MKCIKSIFKFWIEFWMTTTSSNKGFRTNVRAFAAILIPCLLQFPLVAFGQERHDGINGNFIFLEGVGESTKTSIAISDAGDFISKRGFEFNDSRVNNIMVSTTQSKLMSNKNACKSTNDSNYCGDYWDWYIYGVLPFLIWLPILTMPMYKKHNVKVRGSPLLGCPSRMMG
jgi:hypothetical protein